MLSDQLWNPTSELYLFLKDLTLNSLLESSLESYHIYTFKSQIYSLKDIT